MRRLKILSLFFGFMFWFTITNLVFIGLATAAATFFDPQIDDVQVVSLCLVILVGAVDAVIWNLARKITRVAIHDNKNYSGIYKFARFLPAAFCVSYVGGLISVLGIGAVIKKDSIPSMAPETRTSFEYWNHAISAFLPSFSNGSALLFALLSFFLVKILKEHMEISTSFDKLQAETELTI